MIAFFCRAIMKIYRMETSILVLVGVAWCDERLRVGDMHALGYGHGAVLLVLWLVVVAQQPLDWSTAARRCCCCALHFHLPQQSAYDRDWESAVETCRSWAALWVPRQLLPPQLLPVFAMAPLPGESSACFRSSLVGPVGSAQEVPDTSLLEQIPEHDRQMS